MTAAATWTLYDGSDESYFLPYSSSSFGSATAIDPRINVSIGDTIFSAPLDTGSRGASIPQASVPDITQGPDDPSGYLFYWSSGRQIQGYWHMMTVGFPDATGTNTGSVAASATIPVLIVQQIVDLPGDWPNGTRTQAETIIPQAGTSFLNFGIGFDRTGDGDLPENDSYNQNYNPFLNLQQMTAGGMVAGYVLTQNGVQLGLTAANTAPTADDGQSPFAYQKLLPTPFAQVAGSPPDWQVGTGSVVLNGSTFATGQAVLDLGIGNALLSLPSPPAPVTPNATTLLNSGSLVVNLLNSFFQVGYGFEVGGASPMVPQNITWSAIQPGNQAFSENVDQTTFFNTGRNALNGFNYLYDARNGYIGLQLNADPATTGAFLSPMISWQGSVTLESGFSASYPITLAAATTIMAGGTVSLSGELSGGGLLTIGSGAVALTSANANTGGIVIGAGATLELGAPDAAGIGTIGFGGPAAMLRLESDVTQVPTVAGLQSNDFIDVAGINGGSVTVAGTSLTVSNGTSSVSIALDHSYAGTFRSFADGSGGTMVGYVASSQPYVVPLYHLANSTNLMIYAALNGGPLVPYLLDSGSPNMFATYGTWWPGHDTPISPAVTDSFTFANGTTYDYVPVATSVSIGNAAGTVLAGATNVNIAQIVSIVSHGTSYDYANWASAVAQGGAPIAADNSYGNFSAGLYGSNELATVLAQVPIGDGLENGFIIQSGGASATVGTLTIGLDPGVVAAWRANAQTIVLPMAATGTLLPNPDGNAASVMGAGKAQVGNTTITLNDGTTSTSFAIPTVIDTGGGPNNIIYNPGGTPDLGAFLQGTSNVLQNGISYELSGTTVGGTVVPLMNYVTNPGTLPGGGNSLAIDSSAIPGTLRVNPGINLFDQYDVMFDLQDGRVLLRPLECFAAGTRIDTAAGPVAVEALRVGDALPTCLDGRMRRIRWIGRRTIACNAHPDPARVHPVRIAAGAFGVGLPRRDLYLSPDHAIHVEDVLVPVKYLINGTSIATTKRSRVTYYHLELDRHDVIRAEGLPVETYLEVEDRAAFEGGKVQRLHPDFALPAAAMRRREAEGCAPLVVAGPAVAALRRRLAAQAAMLAAGAARGRRRAG
ncbi:MAG: Hint domain-containing protein [Rhodospirillales bacterium]|nr:Hint domain-containing protein [Rhodospirillales bacterium]